MVVGFLTYLVYPALLVLRDTVLWWAIEKFILNDDLRKMIRMRAHANWYLQNKYKLDRKMTLGSDGAKYYLEGVEVTKNEYEENEKSIAFQQNRLDYTSEFIGRKSNVLVGILRHYKFSDQDNPIPKWCRDANESAESQCS